MGSSTPYVPTGFATAGKPNCCGSKSKCVRTIEEEDDNQYLAHTVKRQNRRNKIRHALDSIKHLSRPSSSPTTILAEPKRRNFTWSLETWHASSPYHHHDMRDVSPWLVHLRFLALDLPTQLQEQGGIKEWRNFPVSDELVESLGEKDKIISCSSYKKHGRRIIFSEVSDKGDYLTGRWLVVAYVFCDTRDRLKDFDWMGHVSYDTAYLYKGRERLETSPPRWHMFHEVERMSGNAGIQTCWSDDEFDGDIRRRVRGIIDKELKPLLAIKRPSLSKPRKGQTRKHRIDCVLNSAIGELKKTQHEILRARIANSCTLL
ncbi:hypothetical protein FSARC_12244 [Fusarium sarcochroum]|uniref:Uncharacterized protein n=1 Tax=Fusarium sarcochroum TaxID=1208366 RepID=A0A8H4WXI7_9HYPO|nr:hypothetical protein FSARC_12244 [Fusarium sarcochroum]